MINYTSIMLKKADWSIICQCILKMKNAKQIVQKVVVGGVVIKDNKILIIQRSADEDNYPNLWELPSGKREDFESSEVAVVREVKEETGLTVKVVKPISVFEFKNEKPNEIRDVTQI